MIHIVGLGPGDETRIPPATRALLADPALPVVVRTLRHPAAEWLASQRDVQSCDDLYEAAATFADVYDAIADRVVSLRRAVYAVPGSPTVGELAVAAIRRRAEVTVHPAESFVDAICARVGIDPLADGFQLLNGHDLPAVLSFDVPTVIGHLDHPGVVAEVTARLDRALPDGTLVTVAVDLGTAVEQLVEVPADEVDASLAGLRTSIYVPPTPGGLTGVVAAMYRLRRECPWDRKQTHHSLVRYLHEETAELADALADLGDGDPAVYAEVEEELGDVLLQVLFHAAIAEQAGAFDITDVAEVLRSKLVRRHPHVFADVEAEDAETVRANWDEIKAAEKADRPEPGSVLAGIPASLTPLARAHDLQKKAAGVGFDWPDLPPVLAKVAEELDELRSAESAEELDHELGDLLFAVVNASRHVGVDPDQALRRATHRFEERFRLMESEGPLTDLTLDQLDERWERAKSRTQG